MELKNGGKTVGEIESDTGLDVNGVLETRVKPEALTAGFKERRGRGCGLKSGLCFIF